MQRNTTTILDETEEVWSPETGEIKQRRLRQVKTSKIEPTDEFVKVSKYLNTIFAYHDIPLSLVPISLLFAQYMQFKTNEIILLKQRKQEFAEMLGVSLDRINHMINECKKYDIIRPISRSTYEVNSFLFSTGNIADTRQLQAHFDFDSGSYAASAVQTNRITGQTVRKAVYNSKKARKLINSIPGQYELGDYGIETQDDE